MKNWIVSQRVDEAWLVGTIIKLMDKKLFDLTLKGYYDHELHKFDEDMK